MPKNPLFSSKTRGFLCLFGHFQWFCDFTNVRKEIDTSQFYHIFEFRLRICFLFLCVCFLKKAEQNRRSLRYSHPTSTSSSWGPQWLFANKFANEPFTLACSSSLAYKYRKRVIVMATKAKGRLF